jgi:hypothetical protein
MRRRGRDALHLSWGSKQTRNHLLHGIAGSFENFMANVRALSKSFHVLAIDFVGSGLSGKPDKQYEMADDVRQVDTLLKLEDRFDPSLYRALRGAGHDVELPAPFTSRVGHAGALVRHADGRLEGACDPRSDGCVAPWWCVLRAS